MNSGGLLYMYCTICTMYSVMERVDGADVAPSRDKLFYFLLIFISRLFSLLSTVESLELIRRLVFFLDKSTVLICQGKTVSCVNVQFPAQVPFLMIPVDS